MTSQEIAEIFREIAQILEIKGDNPFRIRAYQRAAETVEDLGAQLQTMAAADKLRELPGIGADLSAKIKEIISTGFLKYYQELKKEVPAGLLDMLKIQGVGPKTVKRLYQELKIDSVKKLEKYARGGKLEKIAGIRQKTQENILRGIELFKKGSSRTLLFFALETAENFINALKEIKEVEKIEAAGSLRRRKDTVRDIDILVVSKKPALVMDRFASLDLVKDILAKGPTKSSVIARENNIQVDLRVIDKKSFGSALLYFTGSKEFNIALRTYAAKKGYKINEYGVFPANVGAHGRAPVPLASKSEEDIFALFKMAYIPAELRENRGELAKACENGLPQLVELKDIKGDFHLHSLYSDGKNKIAEIARTALELGYKYIGISDHSQGLKVAGGLSLKELHKSIEEIKRLNQKIKDIRILCGTEVDISKEGKLDYPDSILKEVDFVIAAIHSAFKQPRNQQTKRIISACQNKYVNFIAHPTGGLWGTRDPYEVDLEEVFKAAADNQVALEINCHPQRYDLNDLNAMKAKEAGVKLVLNTDAHSVEQLELMRLGISIARRGWLTKEDMVNCMDTDEILRWLKK